MIDPTDFRPYRHRPIDIHCHRFSGTGHLQILSLDTHELNDGVADLQPANRYFSAGLHPWFVEMQDIDSALAKLTSLRDHPRLLAIGECGLDKTVETELPRQMALFERHIALAERWQKPLIIHCVRAFNELLQSKKQNRPAQPWIIHGFNNNPALAEQLLRHGCYLSLGKALLQNKSNAVRTLADMPLDRLFLETDAAVDISIGAIYSAAAKITGWTLASLRQQIFSNFNRVFFHD